MWKSSSVSWIKWFLCPVLHSKLMVLKIFCSLKGIMASFRLTQKLIGFWKKQNLKRDHNFEDEFHIPDWTLQFAMMLFCYRLQHISCKELKKLEIDLSSQNFFLKKRNGIAQNVFLLGEDKLVSTFQLFCTKFCVNIFGAKF